MTCPVCKRITAPNASPGEERCGPCHNFRVTGFDKYGCLLVAVDFQEWLDDTERAIINAQNLHTYEAWLNAMVSSAEKARGQ